MEKFPNKNIMVTNGEQKFKKYFNFYFSILKKNKFYMKNSMRSLLGDSGAVRGGGGALQRPSAHRDLNPRCLAVKINGTKFTIDQSYGFKSRWHLPTCARALNFIFFVFLYSKILKMYLILIFFS